MVEKSLGLRSNKPKKEGEAEKKEEKGEEKIEVKEEKEENKATQNEIVTEEKKEPVLRARKQETEDIC